MSQERNEGIIQKWQVTRMNDPIMKHYDCFVMVMDPAHDPHAHKALETYAVSLLLDGYYQLSEEIVEKLKESKKHDPTISKDHR